MQPNSDFNKEKKNPDVAFSCCLLNHQPSWLLCWQGAHTIMLPGKTQPLFFHGVDG